MKTEKTDLNTLPLDKLLHTAKSRFKTCFEPVKINDVELELLQLSDMQDYIDRLVNKLGRTDTLDLPFWAKIWSSAIILSYFIRRLPTKPGMEVLEIGAGVGLCGLIAAKQGFKTTISDVEPNSLLFCRINILKNHVEENAKVMTVDFAKDRLDKKFDYILGAEIVYRPKDYTGLIEFLSAHLKDEPHAAAILSKDYQRKADEFMQLANEHFEVKQNTIGIKEKSADSKDAEKHLINVYMLKPKHPA